MEKVKGLFKWYQDEGGFLLDAYELFDFEDTGRGVRANRAVQKGERFVQGLFSIKFQTIMNII